MIDAWRHRGAVTFGSMAGSSSHTLRLARPYLILAVIFAAVGAVGMVLAYALEINYLSTLLALGGGIVVVVALIRARLR